MAPQLARVYDLYLEDEDEDEVLVGRVQLDAAGQLTLLEAEAEHEGLIEDAVATVNGQDVLVSKVPPPADAPESTGTFSRTVSRDDDDFVPALQTYLKTYYGLVLG